MKLWKFDSYDQYIKAQIAGSKRRPTRRPAVDALEMDLLVGYLKQNKHDPQRVVCHGARCGTEVLLLRARLPLAYVIGTDLAPRGDGSEVIEWDFQKQNIEWVGIFDLVYSNSLDHASDPETCIGTWLDQLKPNGLLVVQWNTNVFALTKLEVMYPGGDCFGAALHEYVDLFQRAGRVRDLIYVGPSRRGGFRVLIVTQPKAR